MSRPEAIEESQGMTAAQTRADLIDAMRQLSLAKGYNGTSVDEVIAASGSSKGSFYHHFSSKEELALAALDAYYDDLTSTFLSYDDPGTGATDRLFAFLDHAEKVAYGSFLAAGCLMGVYSVGLASSNEVVRAKLDEQFRSLEHYVFERLQEAAEETGVDLPSWDLAVQFEALLEGALLLSKAHAEPDLLGRSVALFSDGIRLRLGLDVG